MGEGCWASEGEEGRGQGRGGHKEDALPGSYPRPVSLITGQAGGLGAGRDRGSGEKEGSSGAGEKVGQGTESNSSQPATGASVF